MPKAIFLDRDGVINVNHGHVHSIEKCHFIPGIFEFCRRLQAEEYLLFITTNQAGIARGFYGEDTFLEFMAWMQQQFSAEGIMLTKVYYCPHHPEGVVPALRLHCQCRKPAPGMLQQAINEYNIDPANSWMIGDQPTDMQAAEAVGVRGLLFAGDFAPLLATILKH
jgi:D-glycero-D-manno-heptose 1,7-bisphosphate phosphatase